MMYEELVKRLKELQAITEHCAEQSCDECENRELCDKHDNKTLSGTYKEAADAIENTSKAYQMMAEAYEAEVTKQVWIPVTERLPQDEETVLTWGNQTTILLDWRHDNKWCCFGDCTHWIPLPEPPKEEE